MTCLRFEAISVQGVPDMDFDDKTGTSDPYFQFVIEEGEHTEWVARTKFVNDVNATGTTTCEPPARPPDSIPSPSLTSHRLVSPSPAVSHLPSPPLTGGRGRSSSTSPRPSTTSRARS